jgi:hypothetical protein
MDIFSKLMQIIIQNRIKKDEGYLYLNNYYNVFNNLINFDFKKMTYTGSEEDILDFSKESMFWTNDPIEILIKYTNKNGINSLNDKEKLYHEKRLSQNVGNLIEEMPTHIQRLEIKNFSGLTSARDLDYGTIKNYGNNLLPRSEWKKDYKSFYGFETDDDYEYLKHELFDAGIINSAVLHKWSGRLYFLNKNGSHRLAALYRQDVNQNRNTAVELELYEKKLNIDSAKIIFQNYIGIITTHNTYKLLVEQLKQNNIEVFLENDDYKSNLLAILWVERSKNKLLYDIVNFIKHISLDRCYIISNVLERYI